MYYRLRYYDLEASVFTSRDPIHHHLLLRKDLPGAAPWEHTMLPQPYAYVNQMPTRLVDPMGLEATIVGGILGFGASAAGVAVGSGVVTSMLLVITAILVTMTLIEIFARLIKHWCREFCNQGREKAFDIAFGDKGLFSYRMPFYYCVYADGPTTKEGVGHYKAIVQSQAHLGRVTSELIIPFCSPLVRWTIGAFYTLASSVPFPVDPSTLSWICPAGLP
jgi:hypothetical protein